MNDEALTLDPDRCVLIIQDLQNDVIIEGGAFAESGSPGHAKEQNVVENVKALAETCRSKGIPVIHVWYIVEEGAPGLKLNAPLFQGVKDTGALVRGTWGAAPAEGLEAQDGDFIIEKMRMSAWQGTKLETLLAGLGRDTIIITGAWTNMSIEHTARTGADKGFFIVVPGGRVLHDECRLARRLDQPRAPERLHRHHLRRGDGGAGRRTSRRLAATARGGVWLKPDPLASPLRGFFTEPGPVKAPIVRQLLHRELGRFGLPALAVVLAHRAEDVEHESAVRTAERGVLDPARKHVCLERLELVRHALDDERLHALEDDPELLVRMAVERDGRAGLEADQVQHRAVSEERPTADPGSELERARGVEPDELRFHVLDYRSPHDRGGARSASAPGVRRRRVDRRGLRQDFPGDEPGDAARRSRTFRGWAPTRPGERSQRPSARSRTGRAAPRRIGR